MQRRHAAQNYYYFGLVLVGILLSTVSRRIEPLCAVLPLALSLIHSRLVRPQPAFTLQCTVHPLRAFEGDAVAVRITITATTSVPLTELWHRLPAGAVCPAGDNRLLMILHAGEERLFTHQVVFARRGKYKLGQVYCRVHPGMDLQPLLAEYNLEQVCAIYPHITALPRHLPPLHTHVSVGNYISKAASEGLEFATIRPYNSGDRLHRVHWCASLARQQLYVNDYYVERNADVVILLDTLTALGGPPLNTLDMTVRAAASLATHYLSHKDRVGLLNYGGVCTWLSPALGRLQLHRILDTLLDTRPHFSYLTKDIALVPPRALPPGALIVALTTLLDARIEVVLRDLLARAFPLVLLVISPVYVTRTLHRHEHREAVARLWRLETELRLHEFRNLGVPVLVQESEDPLSALHTVRSRGNLWRRVR
ncbi:hypothetical protein NKDENANG_01370 [Candidatus Entotheonellaceae bacterium PAL068K]